MNLQNLFSEIEKVDGEIFDRLAPVSRRGLFSSLTKKTIAVAAPTIMASALTEAYGQGSSLPQNVKDVLNFALALEYLEFNFYNYGRNLTMIPVEYRAAFESVSTKKCTFGYYVRFLALTPFQCLGLILPPKVLSTTFLPTSVPSRQLRRRLKTQAFGLTKAKPVT